MALVRESKPLFDAVVEAIAALSDLAHSLKSGKRPTSSHGSAKNRGKKGTGRHRYLLKASKVWHDITDKPDADREPPTRRRAVGKAARSVVETA